MTMQVIRTVAKDTCADLGDVPFVVAHETVVMAGRRECLFIAMPAAFPATVSACCMLGMNSRLAGAEAAVDGLALLVASVLSAACDKEPSSKGGRRMQAVPGSSGAGIRQGKVMGMIP